MTATHFNTNAASEPLNVFMIDCSASMLTKGVFQKQSTYAQAHKIAYLLRTQPNTLILGVSSEGAAAIDPADMDAGMAVAGGRSTASTAQDVIDCIEKVTAPAQSVNIIYFSDEQPKDTQKYEKDFLGALGQYTSSLDIMSRYADTIYITPYDSNASSSVPYIADTSEMKNLVQSTWKDRTVTADNRLKSLMMKADTDLKEIRDELSLEIEKKSRAADQLETEIEQKKKIHAEQKSDISEAKQRLAILDKMIDPKNGKRPSGPPKRK